MWTHPGGELQGGQGGELGRQELRLGPALDLHHLQTRNHTPQHKVMATLDDHASRAPQPPPAHNVLRFPSLPTCLEFQG